HSVKLSPDNRFAIVTDAGTDEVLVYRFDSEDGALAPNGPAVKVPGTAPRHFAFHPTGPYAYIVGEKSVVIALRWDNQRGVLTPIQTIGTLPPDFQGVSGAAEVLVHPSGRFLYAS